MDIEIDLENSNFPWEKTEKSDQTCWIKGELFYNDEPLQGSAILSLISSLLLSSTDDTELLKDLLLKFNGSYAFVIKTSSGLLCVVDRIRSIPLFYAKTDARLLISDDANYLRGQINPLFDEKSGAEFLVTGYVSGSATLFEGIYQLQAGEYLNYSIRDDHLTTSFYHRFWHEKYYPDSEEELMNRLDEVFVRVYERLIASIKDKRMQIVVPLSGGLDSRIIVAMLKRCGVDDVICFTYGRKGSREAKISRQVAEALGYQWLFVEYSKENCNFQSESIKKYIDYGANLVSLPHLQDLFALNTLIGNGKIPENAIFIPGHSGMIAGKNIPDDPDQPQDFSDATFLQHILKTHYRLWDWNHNSQLSQIFKEKIKNATADVAIHDKESWVNATELWDFHERQVKYIINSVRVYEFFGYPWRIPLCDNEVIDFFEKIPLESRKTGYLYKKYAAEKLFVNAFRDLGQIDCTTTLSDKHQRNSLLDDYLAIYRQKVNFFVCIFSPSDIGCALVWAFTGHNLSLVKMKSAVFGYRSDSYHEYKSINEIIVHTQNARSIPSPNGLGAHTYLSRIIGNE